MHAKNVWDCWKYGDRELAISSSLARTLCESQMDKSTLSVNYIPP